MTSQQGREDARSTGFDELVASSYRKVYNMAYRLTTNRSDAEDLTQETFFRAYRAFDDFQGDRPFENWALRIVTRLFFDLLRGRRRRVSAISFDAQPPGGEGDSAFYEARDDRPNAEDELLSAMPSERLRRALALLSDEQRTLVKLVHFDELPYCEISDLLGEPVGTIRSRLHRAHRRIRLGLEQPATGLCRKAPPVEISKPPCYPGGELSIAEMARQLS